MNAGDLAMLSPYGVGALAGIISVTERAAGSLHESILLGVLAFFLGTYASAQLMTVAAIRLDLADDTVGDQS